MVILGGEYAGEMKKGVYGLRLFKHPLILERAESPLRIRFSRLVKR
jgi:hypothetical protein